MMIGKIRIHILVDGTVHGVSFRSSTRKEALKNQVTGWVKNLPDGKVEALLEGDEKRVWRLIEWCRRGPVRAQVKHVIITQECFTGEFNEFSIEFYKQSLEACA